MGRLISIPIFNLVAIFSIQVDLGLKFVASDIGYRMGNFDGLFWLCAERLPSPPLLTEDLDVDGVSLALADGVDGDAGDVGLGLQRDGVDGPVAAVHVADHVAPAHPDEAVGLGAARVADVAGEGDRVALHHLLGIDAQERLAGRICNKGG